MPLRNKIFGAAATAVLAGTVAILPATIAEAAPAQTAPAASKVAPSSVPVTGTLADSTTSFNGTLSDLSTSVVNGVLTLTGTITDNATGSQQTFSAPLQTDQLAVNNSCSILTLDLGELNLDVLGLVVDLAPVHLDITAVPGAGNLLGNLLCSVAGLLDNGGPVQGISALLNRLLTGLGL